MNWPSSGALAGGLPDAGISPGSPPAGIKPGAAPPGGIRPGSGAAGGCTAGGIKPGSAAATAPCKVAIVVPTGTVTPSVTRIWSITPSMSDSYVIVALSVSISTIGSPRRTLSPGPLSQCTTVPSAIVSERRGMTISATAHHSPIVAIAAATMFSACGNAACSSGRE
jgi:hypothetical protein